MNFVMLNSQHSTLPNHRMSSRTYVLEYKKLTTSVVPLLYLIGKY
jgi:hypothetical protein